MNAPCPPRARRAQGAGNTTYTLPAVVKKNVVILSAVVPLIECLGYNSGGSSLLSALAGDSSGASGAACGDFFSVWRLRMSPFPLDGLSTPGPRACPFPFP